MLEEALTKKFCAMCKYAYIEHRAGWGLCKNQKNAFGPFPAMIDEVGSCRWWERKK
jgi:hypothetical protein